MARASGGVCLVLLQQLGGTPTANVPSHFAHFNAAPRQLPPPPPPPQTTKQPNNQPPVLPPTSPPTDIPTMASCVLFVSPRKSLAGFRPSKARQGITSFHLRQYAQATLGSGSLRKVVMLPEGEDENEWLAFNLVDFYNQINLLVSVLANPFPKKVYNTKELWNKKYGAVSEFCTTTACPEMKATDEFEYLWQDNDKYKKPTKMPASQYVEHLMSWVQRSIDDDKVFPSRNGVEFSPEFRPLITNFFKRLARVYAHVYCHHFPIIGALALDKHMNTSFKHFVLFVKEFKLDVGRDYWGPLQELVDTMMASADQ
ncbi:hypothetical protein H072_736 [Dactylellina haptotyla CBS 200.50]|uniref:Maintenance of ploidy protein mob1 n=1 Tax=Dactylellina haptotyla (strain CBS 200.50) TaxID=1284197 RepID=S8CC08_DACHA|nr:hypothetical protein H072_736 [Dactylellina haptotyla CBS 200.50]